VATLLRRSRSDDDGPAAPRTRPVAVRAEGAPRKRFRQRVDDLVERLSPGSLRRSFQALERRIGITRVGQIAVIGAVLMWVLAYVVAGTAMYLFAYGIALLLVVSYALAPRRLKLTGDRSGLFPRAREGDRLDVDVTLTANRSVSTFILEERVPERLGTTVKVPVTKLSRGSEVTHRYGLRCTRRGVYKVGPLVAVASDPLGLTERETVVAEEFELLVHPRIELVSDRPLTRQFEDPPIRPPVSKPWPSGLEFYGMREYVPGDDLRRIVWRASARTGKVMVREAEQGITDRVTIILDTNRAEHSKDGEGLSESFEAGVRVAASLGVRHLREGYEVKIEANGGSLTRHLRTAGKQLMMLDSLARVELDREPLSQAIMRLVVSSQRDAHNILITPHLGPREAGQLRLLLNTGVSVMVVALLWDEDHADTMGIAASLGCQVVAVKPGQDLTTALYNSIGAGNRI
jgi:uncharacterized protein (DUF58 family)